MPSLLDIGDDHICTVFAGRVLDGRCVCKALNASLLKSGSVAHPLRLHIIAPPDAWSFLTRFAHVQVLVCTDDEMQQCSLAGLAAIREVGYHDIDNAVELDYLRLIPMNKNIWRVASDVAHENSVLPRIAVLRQLVRALRQCCHVHSPIHYWLARRLLSFTRRPEVFNLGLELRLMYPQAEAHPVLLLHDLVSAESVTIITQNYYARQDAFQCSLQTLIDLVSHSTSIMISHDTLVQTGCLNAVLHIALGGGAPLANVLPGTYASTTMDHASGVWHRDMRHQALVALVKLLARCDNNDCVIKSLLESRIIQIIQAAACSLNYYFAVPACMAFYEMCKIDSMCTAMVDDNVQEVLAWMCRHDMPQAVVIMTQMLNCVASGSTGASRDHKFLCLHTLLTETMEWLYAHAAYCNFMTWFSSS